MSAPRTTTVTHSDAPADTLAFTVAATEHRGTSQHAEFTTIDIEVLADDRFVVELSVFANGAGAPAVLAALGAAVARAQAKLEEANRRV